MRSSGKQFNSNCPSIHSTLDTLPRKSWLELPGNSNELSIDNNQYAAVLPPTYHQQMFSNQYPSINESRDFSESYLTPTHSSDFTKKVELFNLLNALNVYYTYYRKLTRWRLARQFLQIDWPASKYNRPTDECHQSAQTGGPTAEILPGQRRYSPLLLQSPSELQACEHRLLHLELKYRWRKRPSVRIQDV